MRAACGMASEGPVRARMLVGITRETWRRAGGTDSVGAKNAIALGALISRPECDRFHLHGALARARGTHLFNDICAQRITCVTMMQFSCSSAAPSSPHPRPHLSALRWPGSSGIIPGTLPRKSVAQKSNGQKPGRKGSGYGEVARLPMPAWGAGGFSKNGKVSGITLR